MPWESLPGRRDEVDPRHLGESLDRLARSLGAPDAAVLGGVFSRWEEMVGPGVAAHSKPVKLVDGVLVVAVDEPGWATQLRWLEADVLVRLGALVGEGSVTRLEVRVRP